MDGVVRVLPYGDNGDQDVLGTDEVVRGFPYKGRILLGFAGT